MIVRQSDAHAWAEALLNGQWQRFDPTGAVAPSRIESGLGSALPSADNVPYLARAQLSWLKDLQPHWDAVNHSRQRSVIGFNANRQRSLFELLGIEQAKPWQLVAWLVCGGFLWTAILFSIMRRRRSRTDAATQLWTRMCERFGSTGLPRHSYEGPLAYSARVQQKWPEVSPLLARVVDLYTRVKYGSAAAEDGLLRDLKTTMSSLPTPRMLRDKAR